MRQLQIGQVGVGTWGQVMLGVFTPYPRANVVAVCDVSGDRAKAVAERFGVPAYYDNLEEFLKHPGMEAVGVATPDFAHREAVVSALDAGKHVIVQKPMATTVEDCKAMAAAAERSGRHLYTDFQHRWGIGFAEAKKAAEAESFGPIVHGHIRMSNTQRVPMEMLAWANQSSVLWFLGTHTADLVRFITGSEVKSVHAVSRRNVLKGRGVDTPDFFQATLEMESGACIQMENSWVMPEADTMGIEMTLNLYGARECVRVSQSPNNVIIRSGPEKVDWPARSVVMARGLSIHHFIDSVLDGRAPSIAPLDGLMNTAILVTIEKSVAEGRVVQLKEVL